MVQYWKMTHGGRIILLVISTHYEDGESILFPEGIAKHQILEVGK